MKDSERNSPAPILPKFKSSYHHEDDVEYVRKRYEEMGIKILEDRDELTWRVEFPEGWSEDFDGVYWVNVYDESGKERFAYFCKQCFWDYDMFVHFRD